MCKRVECDECGKPTFKGCGMHIEQVLGDVPPAERCRCREEAQERRAATREASGSWLDRLRKSMS